MPTDLENAVARRRTFAIIAHPDADKTTLIEKLLQFGGTMQIAGVKARREQRGAISCIVPSFFWKDEPSLDSSGCTRGSRPVRVGRT